MAIVILIWKKIFICEQEREVKQEAGTSYGVLMMTLPGSNG